MRWPVREASPAVSQNAIVLGSAALLLSGIIQLAVSWMQMQYRAAQQQQCGYPNELPSYPNFEDEYSTPS